MLVFSTAGIPLLLVMRSAVRARAIEAARICTRWRPALYLMVVPSALVAAGLCFTQRWPPGALAVFWNTMNAAYAITWVLALVGLARP